VVNRAHPRYAGRLNDVEAARHIAAASGSLGSCASYLQNTLDHLVSLGIRDAGLQRIVAGIAKA
jgi:glutathione-specific gamma-glutamylcyclotransferase